MATGYMTRTTGSLRQPTNCSTQPLATEEVESEGSSSDMEGSRVGDSTATKKNRACLAKLRRRIEKKWEGFAEWLSQSPWHVVQTILVFMVFASLFVIIPLIKGWVQVPQDWPLNSEQGIIIGFQYITCVFTLFAVVLQPFRTLDLYRALKLSCRSDSCEATDDVEAQDSLLCPRSRKVPLEKEQLASCGRYIWFKRDAPRKDLRLLIMSLVFLHIGAAAQYAITYAIFAYTPQTHPRIFLTLVLPVCVLSNAIGDGYHTWRTDNELKARRRQAKGKLPLLHHEPSNACEAE